MQSRSIDDPGTARLRDFLLGALPPEEAERIEETLLIDSQVLENIEAVEADLFDAFVANALTPVERAAFLKRYPDQHGLNFARALAKRAERPNNVTPIVRGSPFRIWAVAAAVLIVVAAVVVVFNRQQRSLPGTTASTEQPTSSPATTSTQPTAIRTVALALALTAMRDGGDAPHVTIPQSADAVAINIRLNPADRFPEYGVIIRRADETAAWSDEHAHLALSADLLSVTVQVPSRLLPAGDYRLAVSGKRADATTELLGDVRFSVATPSSSPPP